MATSRVSKSKPHASLVTGGAGGGAPRGSAGASGVSSNKAVDRDDNVYKAKLCEQVQRYEEMADCMKKVAHLNLELTVEERNLFSVAYKYVIDARRESWKIALALMHAEEAKGEEEANQTDIESIHMYKHQIKHEMREICHDVMRLLDHHLLPHSTTVENKVFFYKMKGDYYRYLTDITIDEERNEYIEHSMTSYKAGSEIAKMELSPTNPIRLGLALNLSVLYHEVLGLSDRACMIAKVAFDDAVAEVDELSEETFKDSTHIMHRLRNNLTLWTSDVLESGKVEVTQEDVEPDEDDLDLELSVTSSAEELAEEELEQQKHIE